MQELFGHGEILARHSLELTAALRVALKLCCRRARLGANSRPTGQKQRHERDTVEVCGLDQVTVPHSVGMARQSSPPQIHQEKGEIVEDVRAGNLVVELDAVEERRSPVQQHDVAQMEIAVTLPNETGLAPAFEHLRTAIELATGVVSHAIRGRWIQTRAPELGESGGVPLNDPGHARLAAVIRARLGGLVKVGDCRRQGGHELDAQGTDRCQSIEQCLREPIHLYEPVNGLPVPPSAYDPSSWRMTATTPR